MLVSDQLEQWFEGWCFQPVLILVLVDVGLGPLGIPVEKKNHSVLILVLVDVGLGLV